MANRQSRFTVSTDTCRAAAVLLEAQAREEAQLHDLGLAGVNGLESPQRVIQFDEVLLQRLRHVHRQFQGHLAHASATLVVVTRARMIDEDTPHRARRHGEEVGPILPLHAIELDQPEVRLVDERGRLQRVAVTFVAQVPSSQVMQLMVHAAARAGQEPRVRPFPTPAARSVGVSAELGTTKFTPADVIDAPFRTRTPP